MSTAIDPVAGPTDEQVQAVLNHRSRAADAMRKARAALSEIGEIPPVIDPARRARCERDLHAFLQTYFPNSTGLSPFGEAQIKAIKRLEAAILGSGRTVTLLPRGFCKSSISEIACCWAALYGHRLFILFLGANETMAATGLDSIQSELLNNPLLLADFPETCYPIVLTGGKPQRGSSQTYQGVATDIEWTTSRIVLPTIPGSKASGVVISADGLLSASRGARYTRKDGTKVRVQLVIVDDPQTDASALSQSENAKRLRILTHGVSRLGGHGKQVAVVVNATPIADGDMIDQLTDKKKHPSWTTTRAKSIERMPDALDSMWLREYADILKDFDDDDVDGQRHALDRATEFYIEHRAEMDAGAIVAWEHIPLEPGEISALQHALNVLILEGQSVFDSEIQSTPSKREMASAFSIPKTVGSRTNGYQMGTVPEYSGFTCFHIDCHDEVLYYSRAAVRQDFTGAIIEYGSWPEQPIRYFSHDAIKVKLADFYRQGIELSVRMGLIDLIKRLGVHEDLPLGCGLVDAGYKPDTVLDAIRMARIENVFGSKGLGIGPTEKPMAEYDLSPKRCLRSGPDPSRPRWYFPREFIKRVHFDSNYWKDIAAVRLTQSVIAGAWTLFGDEHTDHTMYADHLLSEQPIAMTARGRTVNVWRVVAHRPNHYWDTFVGCCVAASISGAQLAGIARPKLKPRRPAPRRDYGASQLDC